MTAPLARDFPGLTDGWHYLDTAATAQKPRAVIDATVRAMGTDYATVHRGVYARSADMTIAFEAARATVARFLGGSAAETIFVRGATEAINLVAQSWGQRLGPGDRILLSALEHHANIVPWQMLRDRTGVAIDVCPLTPDGRIDLDAAAAMLTPAHRLVAFAHVSNVLGGVLDARRAADLAHGVGALLLLDGCQAAARIPVDIAATGCDFYVCSAHKLYGPTGIGALWVRDTILADMPPWQGGGAMIDRVTFDQTSYARGTQAFEAGTPAIVEAIGFAAACDYLSAIGMEAVAAHEDALVGELRTALTPMNDITLFGPSDAAGIVSFAMNGIHSHDIGTILDEAGVAVRAGHHCAQPLMAMLGVEATVRASMGVHSGSDDIAALVDGLARVRKVFG